MWKLVVFVCVSVAITAISWRSLRQARAHGFPRFFAWEACIALILLNLEHWFEHPWSPPQIVSWLFLAASIYLVLHGVHLLRIVGQPRARTDPTSSTNFAFENTAHLVEVGAYRYIRHPLYSSLLFLAWGSLLKHLSLLGIVLAALATACVLVTALLEERENLRSFGAEYASYMQRTRRFIPFFTRAPWS